MSDEEARRSSRRAADRQRELAKRWRRTLRKMGVRLSWDDDEDGPGWLRLRGGHRGCRVHGDEGPGGQWRVEIRSSKMVKGLALRSQGAVDGLAMLLGRRDLVIGDAAFDAAVFVQGDAVQLRACLDPGTRRRVLTWLEQDTRIQGDELVWQGTLPEEPDEQRFKDLVALVRGLVALARSLSPGKRDDQLDRLRRHVARDPHPRVRARCFELLAERLDSRALDALFERLDSSTLTALVDHVDDEQIVRVLARLGEVGERDALPVLVAHGQGLFRASAVKEAARAAQARLLERLGAGPEGSLSVVDAAEGRLAVADVESE